MFVIPTLSKGGMERVLSELANNLIKRDLHISIVCLITDNSAYDIDKRIRIIKPNFGYSKGLINKIRVFKFLFNTVKNANADVIVSFSEVFNPLTIAVAKLLNKRVFISDRSSPTLKHTFRDRITRLTTYWLANGMIAQTELAKQIFLKKGYNSNIAVIPNPLKKMNNCSINSDLKGIVTVGRLVDSKNQKELIKLFHEINREDWVLYIVGGGKNYKSLQDQIETLELENKVILTGEIDDVDYWLSKGSIFAYMSLSEGFPNALSEALAYPLASIAYNCEAGVSDLIKNNENGILIDLHDYDNYKTELLQLMDNADWRKELMNESLKNRDKFSGDSITTDFYNFIK